MLGKKHNRWLQERLNRDLRNFWYSKQQTKKRNQKKKEEEEEEKHGIGRHVD